MSERVLGIISGLRFVWLRFASIFEEPCFTADRVIVARMGVVYGWGEAPVAYQAGRRREGFTGSFRKRCWEPM